MSHIGNAPNQPTITSMKVTNAIDKSASIIIFFLSYRSIKTPINGPNTACGKKPSNVASDRIAADFVLSVKYQMIAIWMIELVKIDIAWPVHMTANLFFQDIVILSTANLSSPAYISDSLSSLIKSSK